MPVGLLEYDVVHDQLWVCLSLPLAGPQTMAGCQQSALFGRMRLTSRKMLEHHHPSSCPALSVVLAQLVQVVGVVGVAGGGAVAGAGLAGGGAHHARLGHDGVERVDLHVDVVTTTGLLGVPRHSANIQLSGPCPHLRPWDAAVQCPAVLRP